VEDVSKNVDCGIVTILFPLPARTAPECVLSAPAAAIEPELHGLLLPREESTIEIHLLFAKLPVYVTIGFDV
jgi:hypothetical protein